MLRETSPEDFLDKLKLGFSTKEKQIIIGEMSNWKNTTNYRQQLIEGLSDKVAEHRIVEQTLDTPWNPILDERTMLLHVIDNTPYNTLDTIKVVKRLLKEELIPIPKLSWDNLS